MTTTQKKQNKYNKRMAAKAVKPSKLNIKHDPELPDSIFYQMMYAFELHNITFDHWHSIEVLPDKGHVKPKNIDWYRMLLLNDGKSLEQSPIYDFLFENGKLIKMNENKPDGEAYDFSDINIRIPDYIEA